MDQTTSPRSTLYEESSMDYQLPPYCYETPPQEPRYQPLENSKPILTIVEPRANCWEPIISTQVTDFLVINGFKLEFHCLAE